MALFARKLLPYLMFPLLMSGGIGMTFWLMSLGQSPLKAFGLVSIGFVALVFMLEKWLPARSDWVASDGQELNDIGHGLFGTGLGAVSGEALSSWVFGAIALWTAAHLGYGLWPSQLAFGLQVVLVYLLADLGRYIQHRLMHRYEFLWRYHALHHSVNKMGVLKNSRSHFVERFFQPICMFGLIILLGAPAEVVFWYIMPNSFLGILDHSNLDVRIGPLSYLVNGPAEHRLHHSRDLKEGNSNFGSALVLWDLIFGTYLNPRPHLTPQAVGIENDSMPTGFAAQLAEPFLAHKPEAAEA